MWHRLAVVSDKRNQLVDITARVQEVVTSSGIVTGLCQLFAPHTTAGLLINEACDPHVARDILTTLERLVPNRGDYRHAEGNSDAHLKSVLTGCHLTVPVEEGRLSLGPWQGLFLADFDGPRQRQVMVAVTALS